MKTTHSLMLAVFILAQGMALAAAKDGDFYYALGQDQEQTHRYLAAAKNYTKAAVLYVREGKAAALVEAKNAGYRMTCITATYALTFPKLTSAARTTYPWASNREVAAWLATMPLLSMTMDNGIPYYFAEEPDNLKFRNVEVMAGNIVYHKNSLNTSLDKLFNDYIQADYSRYELPYDRPLDILADFQFVLKKSKLPKSGIVRVWVPVPIRTACQEPLEILCLEPARYLVTPPDVNADIGVAYFEIPVAEVHKEVAFRLQIGYRRYQQRFVVDPALVGAYDTGSALYQTYTRNGGNIFFDQTIQDKAKAIVGTETNPYRQAKLIYDYIVRDVGDLPYVKYSYTPHAALQATGTPESVFVDEHQFGDCGAQSMYFCALCRSLGIPTRACGGFQMFSGNPGTHFWAEFYLPAPYDSWLPVDPTAASLIYEATGYSDGSRQAFLDYFFAQQDPLRMNIQNDVDVPLSPLPEEDTYLKLAFQSPIVLFYGSDKLAYDGSDYAVTSYGDLKFNYDNAISVSPGRSLSLAAADFGLPGFAKNATFYLKTMWLGKEVKCRLKSPVFTSDFSSVEVQIPATVDAIAYQLCVKLRGVESVSPKRVIVRNP